MTMIRTLIPRTTPKIEIKVISERKVRFGFRYRNARKYVNGKRIFRGTGREALSTILSVKESAIELQPSQNDDVANGGVKRFTFLFDQRLGQEKCDNP